MLAFWHPRILAFSHPRILHLAFLHLAFSDSAIPASFLAHNYQGPLWPSGSANACSGQVHLLSAPEVKIAASSTLLAEACMQTDISSQ